MKRWTGSCHSELEEQSGTRAKSQSRVCCRGARTCWVSLSLFRSHSDSFPPSSAASGSSRKQCSNFWNLLPPSPLHSVCERRREEGRDWRVSGFSKPLPPLRDRICVVQRFFLSYFCVDKIAVKRSKEREREPLFLYVLVLLSRQLLIE